MASQPYTAFAIDEKSVTKKRNASAEAACLAIQFMNFIAFPMGVRLSCGDCAAPRYAPGSLNPGPLSTMASASLAMGFSTTGAGMEVPVSVSGDADDFSSDAGATADVGANVSTAAGEAVVSRAASAGAETGVSGAKMDSTAGFATGVEY